MLEASDPRPESVARLTMLRWGTCLVATAALVGCAPATEDSAEKRAPRQVEEIPVTTDSEAARALFAECQYLVDVRRVQQANEKCKAAIAEDPTFAYAHFNQSNAPLSFKEFQQAVDEASANLDGKSEGERLLVEVNRSFLTNDSDAGLASARQLVLQYPNSPRAHLALAGILGTRNEHVAARQSMNEALELDPKSVSAAFVLGNSYLYGEPRDFGKAESYIRQLISLQPDEAKAYEALGDVKRAQKDLQAALEAYTQATDMDATLAVTHLKTGHVNSFLGNVDEARASYDAAIEEGDVTAKASYANYRAFTHIHAGDIQAALDELKQLAGSVEKMGTPEGQVKGVKVFTLTNLATAALHSGKLDQADSAIQARNELNRAIGAEVGTDDSKRLVEANCKMWEGLLAAYQGEYDDAQKRAEENAQLLADDKNPRKMEGYHRVMGLVHLRQEDFAKAVEHLRQADHQNNMYIRYHLALAEEGAGNTAEAKKLFTEVSEWNFNSVGFALVRKHAAERAGAS